MWCGVCVCVCVLCVCVYVCKINNAFIAHFLLFKHILGISHMKKTKSYFKKHDSKQAKTRKNINV